MKKALNTEITEEMAKELHEKYTKAYPYPEGFKKETIDKKEWYLGNLITINLDGYPALGRFFIQIWEEDFVVARVYGNSEEEVISRANALLSQKEIQE